MPVPRRQRCSTAFFDRHHVDVARELLGCELLWDGVGGLVVETEAYAAVDDPACHTSFRPSARKFFQTHSPGTVYVYMNYGVHWLLNVLTRDGIVLFRALQPTRGIDVIRQRRRQQSLTALCSGPGKLGQALQLGPADHGTTLLTAKRCIWRNVPPVMADRNTADGDSIERPAVEDINADGICAGSISAERIENASLVTDVRVGITRAMERPWRFLMAGNPHVSVPHGKAVRNTTRRKRPPHS